MKTADSLPDPSSSFVTPSGNSRGPSTPPPLVGIPRGMLYFHYHPLWSTYLSALGLRVRVSSPTDRARVEQAQTLTGSDLCLPVKVFLAHVAELAPEVDWLFLPRIISVTPDAFMCPKVLGLTDMVRNIFKALPGLLDPVVNMKPPTPRSMAQALEEVGRQFTDDPRLLHRAWIEAQEVQSRFDRMLGTDVTGAMRLLQGSEPTETPSGAQRRFRVGVIGRRYLLWDSVLCQDLIHRLARHGVDAVHVESVPMAQKAHLAARLTKQVYWELGRDLVTAGMHFAEDPEIDGVINVASFGCGQDSFTSQLVEHYVTRGSDKPFLSLVIDEHSADAGLNTRLEAFVDMIERRGRSGVNPLRRGAGSRAASSPAVEGPPAGPAAGKTAQQPVMHLTIPHMGPLHIGFENVFRNLGVQITMPPRPNKEAIRLGSRFSPDCACLPFKLNLGNMIQALQMGATDVIMPGGFGPCRFGYYGTMQEMILKELGYDFRMGSADDPDSLRDMLATVRRIAGLRSRWDSYRVFLFILYRIALADRATAHALRLRPKELLKRSTDRALKQSLDFIDQSRHLLDLLRVWRRIDRLFESVAVDPDRPVMRIGLVGEIFMVLENHANMNVEERLGELGVEVKRGLWLSDWLNDRFRFMPFRPNTFQWALKKAAPYLNNPCGGESVNSVGHAVHFARQGLDGIVHLMPFTCMPELVAQTILNRVATDFDLPVLTLAFDEHTSSGAVQTRIEAFVDCIKRRQSVPKPAAKR